MLIGTNRNNGGGPEDVCECLKRISRNAAFEIHRITFETIEGVFTRVKDFRQLARDIERFCPDVIDGFPSMDAVERELRSSRKLYLWWD